MTQLKTPLCTLYDHCAVPSTACLIFFLEAKAIVVMARSMGIILLPDSLVWFLVQSAGPTGNGCGSGSAEAHGTEPTRVGRQGEEARGVRMRRQHLPPASAALRCCC